eukprot:gene9226-19138_t
MLYSVKSVVFPFMFTGAAGIGAYYKLSDEDQKTRIKRQSLFWSTMLPVYYHYRAVEWYLKLKGVDPSERNAYFEPLHDRYAPKTLELIHQLRGFYIKVGQSASVRADAFPRQYLEEMSTLQDDVPSTGWNIIKKTIEDDLNDKIENVFQSIEKEPLGAASIGQVHKATLLDGTPVVIKVMYPDVEDLFRVDIKTITKFCKMVKPEYVSSLREVEKQFMTEFDYRVEAQHLQEVHDNIMPHWGDKVIIPTPIRATKHLLIMTYIPGIKLIDVLKQKLQAVALKRGITVDELLLEIRQRSLEGTTDEEQLYPYIHELIKTWMDLSQFTSNSFISLYNLSAYLMNSTAYLFGYTTSSTSTSSESSSMIEPTKSEPLIEYLEPVLSSRHIDPIELLKTIFEVHGHQILIDGIFNGDPHPGNILLATDGRLGLVDYGQVKRLSKEHREQLAKLIVGLHNKNMEEVVEAYVAMGFRTRHMIPEVIYEHASCRYAMDDKLSRGGDSMQKYIDKLLKKDPLVAVPEDFIM